MYIKSNSILALLIALLSPFAANAYLSPNSYKIRFRADSDSADLGKKVVYNFAKAALFQDFTRSNYDRPNSHQLLFITPT